MFNVYEKKNLYEIQEKIYDCIIDYIESNELENFPSIPITGLFINLAAICEHYGYSKEIFKFLINQSSDLYFDNQS